MKACHLLHTATVSTTPMTDDDDDDDDMMMMSDQVHSTSAAAADVRHAGRTGPKTERARTGLIIEAGAVILSCSISQRTPVT